MGIKQSHLEILDRDLAESSNPLIGLYVNARLFYYACQRPVSHPFLKTYLAKYLKKDAVFKSIDSFLLNEGGMFKKHVYKICDSYFPLRCSTICVPGIGYGKNLFQLAASRPKQIIAFDFYDYPEEWEFLKRIIKDKFGVEVVFHKGSLSDIAEKYKDYFDFVITDAVLEHVGDLKSFAVHIKSISKKNGIFYASFGPIWYGPNGDHIHWGKGRIYDHLLLPEEEYGKNLDKRSENIEQDSTEGVFIAKNKLLSFLPAYSYIDMLSGAGFEKLCAFAKISTEAVSLLRKKPEMHVYLDNKNTPMFDRFCTGLYLWMRICK
jgi:SAM-dependent methyltransferase